MHVNVHVDVDANDSGNTSPPCPVALLTAQPWSTPQNPNQALRPPGGGVSLHVPRPHLDCVLGFHHTVHDGQTGVIMSRFIVLAVTLAVACSSGGPAEPDFGGEPDINEWPEGVLRLPTCTILKPASGKVMAEIVAGSTDVELVVDDPEGHAVGRVALAFLVDGTPEVVFDTTDVPADGHLSTTVNTWAVPGGDRSLLCQVETDDARVGSETVTVKVDNDAPVVSQMAGGQMPGSNFIEDLLIRYWASDGLGVGTDTIEVFVNGKQVATHTSPDVDGVPFETIVPVEDLTPGIIKVEIHAADLVGNMSPTPFEYSLQLIAQPSFIDNIRTSFEGDFLPSMIRGMVFNNQWVVAAAGKQGIKLFRPGAEQTLTEIAVVSTTETERLEAADMNGDGLDDLVAIGLDDVNKKSILVFLQRTGTPGFDEPWSSPMDEKVVGMALGHLNDDSFRDIALAFNKDSDSLGVFLSLGQGVTSWGQYNIYGGVSLPSTVGIGDFTSDGQNDIIMGHYTKAMVTVFPVYGGSGQPTAGFNTELENLPVSQPGPATSMIIGDWDPQNQGDLAVIVSKSKSEVHWLSVAGTEGLGMVQVAGVQKTGLAPTVFSAGDIDLDGVEDLALLCPGSNMVMLMWGGDGGKGIESFTISSTALLAGDFASDITLADLVTDGSGKSHLDLVILEGDRLSIVPFDGTVPEARRFTGPAMLRFEDSPKDAAVGRFSLPDETIPDHLDLAVLTETVATPKALHFRLADPAVGLPVLIPVAAPDTSAVLPVGLVTADLDGNGYDDFIVPTNRASQMTSTGPGPTLGRLLLKAAVSHDRVAALDFVDPLSQSSVNSGFFTGNRPSVAVVNDFKSDDSEPGIPDLAVIAQWDGGTWFLPHAGWGDGTFAMIDGSEDEISDTRGPVAMAAGNLDGKSGNDMVVANSKTGDVSVFFALALGFFASAEDEASHFAVGGVPQDVAVEYLEDPEDERADIITLLKNDVAIIYSGNTVEPSFEPADPLDYSGQAPSAMALGDVNMDGYVDIVIVSANGSEVSIFINMAQKQFSNSYTFDTGKHPTGVLVNDVDGDKCPEILTIDKIGRTVTVFRNLFCD